MKRKGGSGKVRKQARKTKPGDETKRRIRQGEETGKDDQTAWTTEEHETERPQSKTPHPREKENPGMGGFGGPSEKTVLNGNWPRGVWVSAK
jgi:hypothetical protein